ncbi:MAG: sirohydrochlorin chelatase [Chloroflexi bacterium]|nr:sirohydrochlorin chelatase [Chloroflexota bacterium]
MSRGIALLGHGTKDAEGVAEFLELADVLRERADEPVFAGVLEYPTDGLGTVSEAFASAARARVDELVALPALLHFAGHTRDDIPSAVARARAAHPAMDIRLAGPLGYEERMLAALEDRVSAFGGGDDAALLVVGRGSLNSEANADLFKMARLLWDRGGLGIVEAAFVSLAPPGVAAGIERCRRLGAERVVVAPYFLNTGVLVKRIGEQARADGAEVAPHLGLHPLVVDVLLDRLAQARAGLCPCTAAAGCRLPEAACRRELACRAA